MTLDRTKPYIIISPGSLKGVGYEVTAKALTALSEEPWSVGIVVFGIEEEWKKALQVLGNPDFGDLDFSFITPKIPAGLNPSYSCFDSALRFVAERPTNRALVTGPMAKGDFPTLNGRSSGHTEMLSDFFKQTCTMMFMGGATRLIPLTRHIPLAEVPKALTGHLVEDTLRHIEKSAYVFGKPWNQISIALLGLNPHAGEFGKFGKEEVEWMRPLVARLRETGWNIHGPLSPDTSLTPPVRAQYDVHLSCYHDQLLPAFKGLYFHNSTQITLGLPIIRTSVDHGTAEDIYLKGSADPGGMRTALITAEKLLNNRANDEITMSEIRI